MAKNSSHLKLDTRAIVILIVFIIFMLVGTYLFAGYMLTGSRADTIQNAGSGWDLPGGYFHDSTEFGKKSPGKGTGRPQQKTLTITPKTKKR